jgi:uncharacterized protein YbaR (Trm112 family)
MRTDDFIVELFHKSGKVSYIPTMAVDPELLEILACPNCKTPVTLVKNGSALKCATCKRVYPIKDDIPVMLIDEAIIENDDFSESRQASPHGDVILTTPAI